VSCSNALNAFRSSPRDPISYRRVATACRTIPSTLPVPPPASTSEIEALCEFADRLLDDELRKLMTAVKTVRLTIVRRAQAMSVCD
jgi:hypothetical protein